jgi:AraC-like DNA-binding protein
MHQTQNIQPHFHNDYEFHYIANGSGYFTIENCEFPLYEGFLFYTLPGEIHHIYRKDMSKYLFQYVFHLDELPRDSMEILSNRSPDKRFFHDPGRKGDWERWRRLHESGRELGDRALTLQFLGYILELIWKTEVTDNSMEEHSLLEESLNYIQERLEERLTLNELAAAVRHDKYQLIRYFKRELGMTPQKYWTRLKIESALELIKEGQLNLSEIAERFAFSDEFHLSRTVKKWTGYSPREWRRF